MKKHIKKLAALMLLGSSASYAALVSVPAGDITTDTTWTSSNEYVLEGIVYVKNSTLTIQPGTIIRGQPRTNASSYNPGTLVITKSAKINAVGTATNPIIFTTAALAGANGVPRDTDSDGAVVAGDGFFDRAAFVSNSSNTPTNGTFLDADPKNNPLSPTASTTYLNTQFNASTPTNILAALTGGIVVLGEAPINRANTVSLGGGLFAEGEAYIEGLAETDATSYGGIYPLHNSGKLSYISIRHGGAKLSDANEINGLTLGGVGSGTQIDHIDVYVNFDDGVEVFGGTVNLSYLNINFCEDDGFDVDQGWTGGAQFLFVLQHPSFGDSLVEADGHDQDDKNGSSGGANKMTANGRPFHYSIISNGTFVGRGTTVRDGIRMRAGFGGEVINNIIIQANNGVRVDAATGVETDGFDARTRALTGELVFANNTLFNNNVVVASGSIAANKTYLNDSGADLTYNGVTVATGQTFVGVNGVTAFAPTTARVTTSANSQSWTKSSGTIQGSWDSATASYNNKTSNPGFKTFSVSTAKGVNPVGIQTGQGGAAGAFTQLSAVPNNPAFSTVTYRGAFPTTKTSDLWTNGWTALNKRGVLVSKGNE